MLRLGEFSTRKNSSFITSVDISWLDEFANKSTFDEFGKKYKLPETGYKLFNEIDYENLSGVSNPNLTRAKDALIFINALVRTISIGEIQLPQNLRCSSRETSQRHPVVLFR